MLLGCSWQDIVPLDKFSCYYKQTLSSDTEHIESSERVYIETSFTSYSSCFSETADIQEVADVLSEESFRAVYP